MLSVAFVFITLWQTASSQYDKIVIFDKPQQELKEKVFDVFQVLPNGNALANSESRIDSPSIVALFLANEKCPSTTHKESLSLAASVSCKLASTNTTQIKELKNRSCSGNQKLVRPENCFKTTHQTNYEYSFCSYHIFMKLCTQVI